MSCGESAARPTLCSRRPDLANLRRALGTLFVAAPFVAAAIAALSVRRDLRLAAMAVVATLIAWLFPRIPNRSLGSALLTFGAATLGGVGVALLAGARAPFGVIAVAIVVAAFATAGQLLLQSRAT